MRPLGGPHLLCNSMPLLGANSLLHFPRHCFRSFIVIWYLAKSSKQICSVWKWEKATSKPEIDRKVWNLHAIFTVSGSDIRPRSVAERSSRLCSPCCIAAGVTNTNKVVQSVSINSCIVERGAADVTRRSEITKFITYSQIGLQKNGLPCHCYTEKHTCWKTVNNWLSDLTTPSYIWHRRVP